MTNTFDVVAYTYKAEVLTPETAIRRVARDLGVEHPEDYLDIEEDWQELAQIANVDRMNESSFDSDYFPKVVFRDQLGED